MERSEKWKTLLCFGLFGVVVVGLFGRLTYLQVARAEPNRKSVRAARNLFEQLPAARGEIVDRDGRPLAYDRLTLSVRAEFQARVDKGVRSIPQKTIEFLAFRLASHIAAGGSARTALAQRLSERMRAAKQRVMPSKFKKVDYLAVDFLVCGDLDSHESARRLRREATLWRAKREMPGRLHLSIRKNYKRTYPDREFTLGPVGNHYVAAKKIKTLSGGDRRITFEDFQGLEACNVLWPSRPALAAAHQIDFKDSRRRRFWVGLGSDPETPSRLHSTIDLDLQKAAHAELELAEAAVKKRYGSSYEWGAMVLVEIETGDILAIASHWPGRKGVAPFTPIESAFEPGSIVKPLVIACALEAGRLNWEGERIDCIPTRPRNGQPVAGHPGRIIRDDHRCEVLTARQVIVQSSNIGAVKIGTRLGKAGMRDYLRQVGFCTKTRIGLPREARGFEPEGGIDDLPRMSDRKFGRYTGPSLSFGYELNVTAVQVARAYLRFLAGAPRELRLVRAVETSGKTVQAPVAKAPGSRFLSKSTVATITDAMAGVVSEEDHATGRHLFKLVKERGLHQPLIAGKTGTSDSGIGGVRKKTAAFVGFAPVHSPRYLVVCVLRKDRARGFYGGSYAALPAGRLLLHALEPKDVKEESRRRHRPGLVRAWGGVRGSSPDTVRSSSNRRSP